MHRRSLLKLKNSKIKLISAGPIGSKSAQPFSHSIVTYVFTCISPAIMQQLEQISRDFYAPLTSPRREREREAARIIISSFSIQYPLRLLFARNLPPRERARDEYKNRYRSTGCCCPPAFSPPSTKLHKSVTSRGRKKNNLSLSLSRRYEAAISARPRKSREGNEFTVSAD